MSKFDTHKATAKGKAETITRKDRHRAKRAKNGAQSLKDVATMVNARYIA